MDSARASDKSWRWTRYTGFNSERSIEMLVAEICRADTTSPRVAVSACLMNLFTLTTAIY